MAATKTDTTLFLKSRKAYYDDGNLVLRVEQTHFKVYRGLLYQKSASLRELFESARADPATTGLDNKRAIPVVGDHAKEWENFLWLMFSSVDDVRQFESSKTTTDQRVVFSDAAFLSSKYGCPGILSWALDKVAYLIKAIEFSNDAAVAEELKPVLLEVATTFAELIQADIPHEDFAAWAEPWILRALDIGAIDTVAMLRVAVERAWPAAQMCALYRIVCSDATKWKTLELMQDEEHRVLKGYKILNEYMVQLSMRTLFSDQAVIEANATLPCPLCTEAYEAAWRVAVIDEEYLRRRRMRSPVDVRKDADDRVEIFTKKVGAFTASSGRATGACTLPACRENALRAAQAYLEAARHAVELALAPEPQYIDSRVCADKLLAERSPSPSAYGSPMSTTADSITDNSAEDGRVGTFTPTPPSPTSKPVQHGGTPNGMTADAAPVAPHSTSTQTVKPLFTPRVFNPFAQFTFKLSESAPGIPQAATASGMPTAKTTPSSKAMSIPSATGSSGGPKVNPSACPSWWTPSSSQAGPRPSSSKASGPPQDITNVFCFGGAPSKSTLPEKTNSPPKANVPSGGAAATDASSTPQPKPSTIAAGNAAAGAATEAITSLPMFDFAAPSTNPFIPPATSGVLGRAKAGSRRVTPLRATATTSN